MVAKKKKQNKQSSHNAPPAAEPTSVAALFGHLAAPQSKGGDTKRQDTAPLKTTFDRLFGAGARASSPAKASTGDDVGSSERGQPKERNALGGRTGPKEAHDSAAKQKATTQNSKLLEKDLEEQKKRTLFIGNVPAAWDKKHLRRVLKAAVGDTYTGTFAPIWFRNEPLKDDSAKSTSMKEGVLKDQNDDASDAKTAFVVLESVSALHPVRKAVHGLEADSRHILRADGIGKNARLQTFDRKRSVFVGHLAPDVGEADLRTVFKEAGEIDAVRIIRDKETSKCKGFAFVLFKERRSAKAALDYWGAEVKGREIRVTKVEERGDLSSSEKLTTHPAERRIQGKSGWRRQRKPGIANQSSAGVKPKRKAGKRHGDQSIRQKSKSGKVKGKQLKAKRPGKKRKRAG